ncbi:GlxA family transcriptional regulator [Amnibacterium sp.]|uniref:GlxA family transcriptional regulator n=1 Tax=Amnibacterium sp. TaxID=1872496 RepID=UPI00261C09C0|nr:helix-turn-helix domain-containing protein [Amnibacterium sp.]MCU1473956.1 transcriptional regulator, AraC family [Amnibacterium sp.]
MLRKVAVLAVPTMAPFEFGVLCEVFGVDRTDDGVPPIDFTVVAADPGTIPFQYGLSVTVPSGLEAARDADLVAVPAVDDLRRVDPRILETVRAAHERGAWVLSVCSGAFVLGAAGLLDGRPSTTHWRHAARLQAAHPATRVDPNVLFVEADRIVTSAGTASGIDASLHIIRRELGASAANAIARRMVVPPQRDGGQAQYIALPMPEHAADSLAGLLDWAEAHLDEDLSVEVLARRALMSPRTFARRFRDETGTTPAAWVVRQRLRLAQDLLETSGLPVDEVARRVGFGTGGVLRHHFGSVLGTSPQAYRRRFSLAGV